MDCFRIEGGRTLHGTVRAAGSKNAALPLLAATLLPEGKTRLHGVPELRDLLSMRELLEDLGTETSCDEDGVWELSCPAEGPTEAPYEVVRKMRASVAVLGPLLARRGRAQVSLPGGCVIGVRPIDLHLKGLAALGADIRIEHGTVVAEAPPGGLRGGQVYLASRWGSTVLGTANVMLAAVLAKGTTVLDAAAQEPEIIALADFLNACGAQVYGAGGPRVVIDGVDSLKGVDAWVPADRIEVGTLLLAGAATSGDVTVDGCAPDDLTVLLDLFDQAGIKCETTRDSIRVLPWIDRPRALDVSCRPYPGFPTDLQAQWMAFCTQAEGLAMVTDTVYPDRFMHVAELNRLGAHIRRENGTALVLGPAKLSGAPVLASDLRASAALVIAGLVAEGETIVRRVYHLDRGYERLEDKLGQLGAAVHREVDDSSA